MLLDLVYNKGKNSLKKNMLSYYVSLRFAFRVVMFGSSVPSFVCRRAHVLFTLFVFVCV